MYLRVMQGPEQGRVFPLSQGITTFGRSSDNNVVLTDSTVSRHHARVELRGEHLFLTDLGTSNGTNVNSQRVSASHPLQPNDVIQMGTVILRVENQPLGDETTRLPAGMVAPMRANSRSATQSAPRGAAHPSKRNATWLVFLGLGIVVLLAIVLIIGFGMRGGPVSSVSTPNPAALTITAVVNVPIRTLTMPPSRMQPTLQPTLSGKPTTLVTAMPTNVLDQTPLPTAVARQAKNNQSFKNALSGGLGRLTVKNQYTQDLVFILTDNNLKTLASIYVRAGEESKLEKIRDGKYSFFFVSGTDWDDKRLGFAREPHYFRFEQMLEFKTTKVQSGQQFTTFEVLLGPNVGGFEEITGTTGSNFPVVK